jgi:AcrR family transcriptional regulator
LKGVTKLATVRETSRGKPRRSSRAGVDTRGKMLDAAERLFADNGFDGTSLRDIAEAADLHLALSTYHFGTKERLFEEVISRRAAEMERIRLAALSKIDPAKLPPSEAVRMLITGYALPMIRARYGNSKQWQAHVRLVSQLISVQRWLPIIKKNYDNCGLAYLQKLHTALPRADHAALLDSFSFMISTMLYVCTYTDRFAGMKANVLSKRQQIERATENFIQFVHAGFMSLG